jgi:hypothetical protein
MCADAWQGAAVPTALTYLYLDGEEIGGLNKARPTIHYDLPSPVAIEPGVECFACRVSVDHQTDGADGRGGRDRAAQWATCRVILTWPGGCPTGTTIFR